MILEAPWLLAGLVASSMSRRYLEPPEKTVPGTRYTLVTRFNSTTTYSNTGVDATATSPVLPSSVPALSAYELAEQKLRTLARAESLAVAQAAREARAVYESLPGGLPPPAVVVTDSEALVLVYRKGDEYAEIEFLGNGEYFLYCRDLRLSGGEGIESIPVGDRVLAVDAEVMLLRHFAPQLLALPQAA